MAKNTKHGCHNREFAAGYFAPDRELFVGGTFETRLVWIPHVNSTDCRYDQKSTDDACEGCKHR